MMPVRHTKDQLLGALRTMIDHIERNDSFEGSIEYTALDEHCQPGEFMVRGSFRVGNSEGQGGVILIGREGGTDEG